MKWTVKLVAEAEPTTLHAPEHPDRGVRLLPYISASDPVLGPNSILAENTFSISNVHIPRLTLREPFNETGEHLRRPWLSSVDLYLDVGLGSTHGTFGPR
jgi:hypothetical protein